MRDYREKLKASERFWRGLWLVLWLSALAWSGIATAVWLWW